MGCASGLGGGQLLRRRLVGRLGGGLASKLCCAGWPLAQREGMLCSHWGWGLTWVVRLPSGALLNLWHGA